MGLSYGVGYICAISGNREDLEKVPAAAQKIYEDKQAWCKALSRAERSSYGTFETSWCEDYTKAIKSAAESALSGDSLPAFVFTAVEDDSSHGIMDEVMKALDEALPGLVIVLCAEYERKKCIFISPPGESSLNLNELDLFEGRNDWKHAAKLFRGCQALTCLRLPWGKTLSIGPRTFQGCTNLTALILPKEVTKIDETAFEGCPNLTIYAPSKSFAREFAKEHSIRSRVYKA